MVRTFSPPLPSFEECDAPVQMLNLQATPLTSDAASLTLCWESSCTMLAGQAESCST